MQYSSINIQGNIISSEILEKIRLEDIKYQKSSDFGLDKNTSLRDEIGIAWSAARAHWQAFRMRRDRLKDDDTGTSETRQSWVIPFLRELGYELEKSATEIINNKTYAISHRAVNRDGFPVHIVGINQSLDKRAESGGTRLSPHALVQEYLNNHDHLFALVTNGKFLRMLRDATRLSRLSYLEFNLERMMDDELFSEFALLFRVLHITRMPDKQDNGENSFINFFHQESLASGSRIRERLSAAVEQSLKLFANGLLKHPANNDLRQQVQNGDLKADAYFLYLLRVVYRMLFLMVIEERHLIYPEKLEKETSIKRDIYYKYYSINRLTRLAQKLIYVDPRKTDLWKSLVATFRLFENENYGEKLEIKPLGSGLFASDALGDILEQSLDNGTLLKVLSLLTSFENENKQRVHVNYADLDVEEFGSMYEGLLEYQAVFNEIDGQPNFAFVKGSERSSSGSHYTPEELVKPLIEHSLDYLIADRIKEPDAEKRLLDLKIADVACGSGHILLSAARRVGFELAKIRESANTKSIVEQPSPPYIRQATRDAIQHCIYGVDKNPLAVELCKVALWLEAHNPGEPLNFLDHHIKCGDAIVGLAHRDELENGIPDEAFKTLPGDEKEIAAAFFKRNKAERKTREDKTALVQLSTTETIENTVQESMAEYRTLSKMPEHTPAEINAKQKAYKKFLDGKGYTWLKIMADTQIAQFFIPKTTANKERLMTDADFRSMLKGYKGWQTQQTAMASAVAQEKKIFHWFLEFPEIFNAGGFNCILGNPPYLGGRKISGNFGDEYLNWLFSNNLGSKGQTDLVAYFFNRIFKINSSNSFASLITTNTISQGDTKEACLKKIIENGGKINFSIKLIKWPGIANLYISLITFNKGFNVPCILENKQVEYININLENDNNIIPYIQKPNKNKIFKGVFTLGDGFILDENEMNHLIALDKKSSEIIYPFINGKELNNSPTQTAERYIINFMDMDYSQASTYTAAIGRVRDLVKPIRDVTERKATREYWWIYAENRPGLFNSIKKCKYCLVTTVVTRHLCFSVLSTKNVYSQSIFVLAFDDFETFSFLSCSFHSEWARKWGPSLKTDLSYSSSDCFENYPFPRNYGKDQKEDLNEIGKQYHEHRKQLMLAMQLGLTKTYNLFHSKELALIAAADEQLSDKEFEKNYGKDAIYLRKQLAKDSKEDLFSETKQTEKCTFNEAVQGIIKLRELHVQMDNAVLEAYGWQDVELKHDFYEVDYLPENDRVRYTIHPDARKEILKRLLELNHKIHEEEVAAGLWDKKQQAKEKKYKKSKSSPDTANEDEAGYGDLFKQ